MQWCISDFSDANHPPIVKALGSVRPTAQPGETLTLEIETTDPDGYELETKFWIYEEVGTYDGDATLSASGNRVTVSLDSSATGALHVIAEVKDQSVHPMTRYQRFVIQVGK
ncbi:hypothetical protein [Algoriphagus sp.]|uniref:hypothetical protein n=1 Tax=Algoriphagus sp. TaxID=1872435 RepID=UPI0025C21E7E|nr:hypothetical protein [Algoriphagus sp.]